MHYTPTIEELLPTYTIKCTQANCSAIFHNIGNYELHLKKHHQLSLQPRVTKIIGNYNCPVEGCIYHAQHKGGRNFKNFRYVRQHYQKVHAEKIYFCKNCSKSCLTKQQLHNHVQRFCGRKFTCSECGWNYSSKEAFLTHAKRKGHIIKPTDLINTTPKESIPRSPAKIISENKKNTLGDQNNFPSTTSLATQTPFVTDFDVEAVLRDIETQTDQTITKEKEDLSSLNAVGFLDQMLASSSHMYTQTCDDLLSELGLTDIETQTCWGDDNVTSKTKTISANNKKINSNMKNNNNNNTSGATDMLLVSTETQTSFTQCLLDATTSTSECTKKTAHVRNISADCHHSDISLLYTEQCTQTSDLIYDNFFSADQNDLIELISSYTQT